MIKGGLLALLLCGKGLIGRVVDVPGSSVSLGVYRKEEGEETINNSNGATQSMTWQDAG